MPRFRSQITTDCAPRNAYAAERAGLSMAKTATNSELSRKARVLAAAAFIAVNAMVIGSLSPEAMAATESMTTLYSDLGPKN